MWMRETIRDVYDGSKNSLAFTVPDIESDTCMMRIESVDNENVYDESDSLFTIHKTIDVHDEAVFAFSLKHNLPNPFNNTTSIPFSLAADSRVEIVVYNITGEKVATLVEGRLSAGNHSILWNAQDIASGVYFYRLTAGEYTDTKKMLLVK